MIWFTCKQCGMRHSRPEAEAGTLVFCDCGQGVRVPWQSVIVAEAVPVEAVPAPVPPPRPARQRPILDAEPAAASPSAPPAVPAAGRRPGRLIGKVNQAFCFHHDEKPRESTCDACRLPFCSACVVTLQGKTLCGPCKNFRTSAHGRAPRTLPLAVIALVVSLVSGPVTFILSMAAVGVFLGEGTAPAAVSLCLLASALPVAGLSLSVLAVRRIDTRPQTSGRSLALSGVCVSLVGVLWCLTVAAMVLYKQSLR